ncbi:hypothetical protein M430DRAFT_21436 [Amorphotheca resinae ATCC 22711]|jgi:hypothetical protein|uniref:Uncharacterized protein n=1 Tax=Amorphotheca resinae ATCC 22711 TaxID=857342 RepID=A0A2T3AUK7_AMORE|nr:hypothetical protein M430DRAFT_21436 [Amorphotheca resinae ATCC 22711]PSS12341.1 hypothetical protein M430DRAFT_21436 [Amorphotheca resinae ATCC 22711]
MRRAISKILATWVHEVVLLEGIVGALLMTGSRRQDGGSVVLRREIVSAGKLISNATGGLSSQHRGRDNHRLEEIREDEICCGSGRSYLFPLGYSPLSRQAFAFAAMPPFSRISRDPPQCLAVRPTQPIITRERVPRCVIVSGKRKASRELDSIITMSPFQHPGTRRQGAGATGNALICSNPTLFAPEKFHTRRFACFLNEVLTNALIHAGQLFWIFLIRLSVLLRILSNP